MPGAFYPSALSNQFAGCDQATKEVDIIISINNSVNWYFGTDLAVGPGQYDLVSVVLHELCHGLGFFGTALVDDGIGVAECGASAGAGDGCIGLPPTSTNYMIFDHFVENLGAPVHPQPLPILPAIWVLS